MRVKAAILTIANHTAPASSVSGGRIYAGAIAAGNDVMQKNATFAQALKYCNQLDNCAGFTFKSAEKEPTQPIKMYFKTLTFVNPDGAWKSWIRSNEPSPDSIVSLTKGGRCVDVLGAYQHHCPDGNPVFTYTCHGVTATNQDWVFPANGSAGGQLKSLNKCATAVGASSRGGGRGVDGGDGGDDSAASAFNITMEECQTTGHDQDQTWVVAWPTIKLKGTGLCLDLGSGAVPKYPENPLLVAAPCVPGLGSQDWESGAAAAARVPDASFVKVCTRISTFQPNGEPVQGYCLIVDSKGKWYIAAGGTKGAERDVPNVLATGTLGGNPGMGGRAMQAWHTLEIQAKGAVITGVVDGVVVGAVSDSTFSHGMAAVGSGWHQAGFDDFELNASI